MPAERAVHAVFTDARPVSEPERVGVYLGFRPVRTRLEVDHIEDFADLGPEMCVPSVAGLGKVLRILRAARLAVPADREVFLGEARSVAEKLERLDGRSDEDDSMLGTEFGEARVLAQEAVARVDRVAARIAGQGDDLLTVQVRARTRAAQCECLVRTPGVQ